MKLKTKAAMDGIICFKTSQKSAEVLIMAVEGILISIINKVNAIAKTPSQKASNLEFVFNSDIIYSLLTSLRYERSGMSVLYR